MSTFRSWRRRRVNKTTDVVKEGDRVKVKVMGYDDRGKVKLSMRVVDQQTGADLEKTAGAGGSGDGRIAKSRSDHQILCGASHRRTGASHIHGERVDFPSRNALLTARKGQVRYGVCASGNGLKSNASEFCGRPSRRPAYNFDWTNSSQGALAGRRRVGAEADRQAAIDALTREAEEYGADGVVDVQFEVEGCKGCEIDGLRLERVTATGLAVRFAEAA